MKSLKNGGIYAMLLCLACLSARVGSAQTKNLKSQLPGKSRRVEDEVHQATLIITAVLEDFGFSDPTAAGTALFDDAKFKLTKILKGNCASEITVRFVYIGATGEMHEEPPKIGIEYVLLIHKDPWDNRDRIYKMLPADPQSIANVMAVLNVQSKQ